MSHDCSFCEIVQDPTLAHMILATPTLLVFLDRLPLTRGHILCIPRLHYPHLPTFPSHISAKLGEILPALTTALTQVTGVQDFNVILNNGERAGQTVQHVHWHIIPRPGDGKWNMFARGMRQVELDDDEAAVLAYQVREELNRGLWRTRDATLTGNGGPQQLLVNGNERRQYQIPEHVRGPAARLAPLEVSGMGKYKIRL